MYSSYNFGCQKSPFGLIRLLSFWRLQQITHFPPFPGSGGLPQAPYPAPYPALPGWHPHLHCLAKRVASLILLLSHFPLATAGKLLAFKDLNIRLGPPRIAFPLQGCNLNHIYTQSIFFQIRQFIQRFQGLGNGHLEMGHCLTYNWESL